jgi:hypothetical protein
MSPETPSWAAEIIGRLERIEISIQALTGQQTAAGEPAVADPWLKKSEATRFLNISPASFDRLRRAHPEALKPDLAHPKRWAKSRLEVFQLTQGAPLHRRGRGRARS